MPLSLETTPDGLRVEFSDPVATDASRHRWTYSSWGLKRSKNYGSPHVDEHTHAIDAVDVSSDGRVVTLRIADFAPTWSYELTWDVPAADGPPVRGRIHGTVHALGAPPP